ncbi:VWA domain-containing protein [Thalassospira sp. TSL5-1]|uniref:vWA domain-containing protein n=1 Tax=Thalassospira sp. TSL5-1 TaxID=1544451 RepID=UPI0009403BA4|nr:VWA domain-containing protein [Thalassospira sp. TSL5-1]OKH86693.1 tellerium resistance protein TerY [Thalassospira sp. TSL5-1]
MRRLPVYILLDTSGSMQGEPIEAVNSGMETLIGALRQDPYALETVYMTIITFDAEAKTILPLTALEDVVLPQITTPRSGPTHMGLALETLGRQVSSDIIKSTDEAKGDWAPYLFVMTDGKPSDTQLYQEQCVAMRKLGFANIIGCAAGPKAREDDLRPLCDHVLRLDTMDGSAFSQLFKWVSEVIASGNKSLGSNASAKLPPPPPEINVVL